MKIWGFEGVEVGKEVELSGEEKKFFRGGLEGTSSKLDVEDVLKVVEIVDNTCRVKGVTCYPREDVERTFTYLLYDENTNTVTGIIFYNPQTILTVSRELGVDVKDLVEETIEHEVNHIEKTNRVLRECGKEYLTDESRGLANLIVNEVYVELKMSKNPKFREVSFKTCKNYLRELKESLHVIFRGLKRSFEQNLPKDIIKDRLRKTIMMGVHDFVEGGLACAIHRDLRDDFIDTISKFLNVSREEVSSLLQRVEKLLEEGKLCECIDVVKDFLKKHNRNIPKVVAIKGLTV